MKRIRKMREKKCDRCQSLANTLYRIKRYEPQGPLPQWEFLCPQCYPAVQQRHPDSVYGGTWKARKRH